MHSSRTSKAFGSVLFSTTICATICAAVLATGTGCNDVAGGFESAGSELFEPDISYVARPERLVEGSFSNISVDTDLDGNRFVVALSEQSELTIIPFAGGDACVAGQTTRYAPVLLPGDTLPTLEPLLAFIERGGEQPELRFTDFNCELSPARVTNTDTLPRTALLDGPGGGSGILITTADGRLLFVNPWQGRVGHVLCEAAGGDPPEDDCGTRFSKLIAGEERTWTVEHQNLGDGTLGPGELVIRNRLLQPIAGARIGQGVRDFQTGPAFLRDEESTRLEVSLEECAADGCVDCAPNTCQLRFFELDLPFAPDEAVTSAESDLRLADACFAQYHPNTRAVYFSYFSPCAGGRPAFWQRYVLNPDDRTSLERPYLRTDDEACLVDENVNTSPLLTGNRLTYIKGANSELPGGELWTQLLLDEGEAPEVESETTAPCGKEVQHLGNSPNPASVRAQQNMLRAVIDYDAATRKGQLMVWKQPEQDDTSPREAADIIPTRNGVQLKPQEQVVRVDWLVDEEIEPIESLAGVTETSSFGVLADFDGTAGDLYDVDFATEPVEARLIAKGLPIGGHQRDPSGIALLTNFEGTTGDLMFQALELTATGEPAPIELAELMLIGQGVGRAGYGFAQQFPALIYLADRESENGTSTLKVTLLETGDVFEIARGVLESREVGIPGAGILYSVAMPEEEAGIWFAGAR